MHTTPEFLSFALAERARLLRATRLADLFARDAGRFAALSLGWNDWLLDIFQGAAGTTLRHGRFIDTRIVIG